LRAFDDLRQRDHRVDLRVTHRVVERAGAVRPRPKAHSDV
jgi:hypothetical protein